MVDIKAVYKIVETAVKGRWRKNEFVLQVSNSERSILLTPQDYVLITAGLTLTDTDKGTALAAEFTALMEEEAEVK